MNRIRCRRLKMQVLALFGTASDVAVSRAKSQKNKIKSVVGLLMAVAL